MIKPQIEFDLLISEPSNCNRYILLFKSCLANLIAFRGGRLALQSLSGSLNDREYKVSVLIVDDEETSRQSAYLLCKENFKGFEAIDINILKASSILEALEMVSNTQFHIILLDRDLGFDLNKKPIDSIHYLPEIQSLQPFAEIIILTANEQPTDIAKAMSLGASNYLLKNNSQENIAYKTGVIRNALSNAKLRLQQARSEKEERYLNTDYICHSPAMQQLNMKLEALAETNRPALILGDSGLGKGASARMLNKYRSKFLGVQSRPFFNINIASLNDEIAQSELFGHEANSFTGSGSKPKAGFFELANGGDLFLDEIGDASIDLQTKLLKVVEEREFQRIGGKQTLKTTARIIFATNKNLKELIKIGKFKPDLYARISTFEIEMPSLEQRKQDLPLIINTLIEKANKESNTRRIDPECLPPDLLEYLTRAEIPGNIRGIENDIQRLLLFSRKSLNGVIDVRNWRHVLGIASSPLKKKEFSQITLDSILNGQTDFLNEGFPGLKNFKDLIEEACIKEAFSKFKNQSDRAKALKIHPSVLSRFKEKYDWIKPNVKGEGHA